ncbi:MAG TPA: carbon-nitrogen hydrolase family protein [Solirubrobacteraceae bacterium]|nr:carbon-nitrogen hydrolase family protein [Solirubrobacteraceae bacterium]
MTTLAACAFAGDYDVAANLDAHLRYIDDAADQGAELVAFPEVSLHGYPPDVTAAELGAVLERAYAIAEPVPDGPSVRAIADRARQRRVHVIYGLHEAGERRGIIYNTTVLTGPDGHIGSYRKVHVGVGERLIWRLGHDWPVFETTFGRIGMLICWDADFPESARELTLRGADLLVVCSAWDRFAHDGEPGASVSEQLYELYLRARAAENGRWLIAANYTGELGGRQYIGASQIVSPLGEVLASSGAAGIGLTLKSVELEEGIAAAYTAWEGPYVIRDRRPETYLALNGALAPAIDG